MDSEPSYITRARLDVEDEITSGRILIRNRSPPPSLALDSREVPSVYLR